MLMNLDRNAYDQMIGLLLLTYSSHVSRVHAGRPAHVAYFCSIAIACFRQIRSPLTLEAAAGCSPWRNRRLLFFPSPHLPFENAID